MSAEDPRTGEVYEPTGLVPLLRALCAAQAEMAPALRDRLNPHLRTRYADLTSVWEALRGPLTRHGLVATHRLLMDGEGERMTLETSLWHAASGTALSTLYPLAAVRSAGAQQLGAALTYARRYSLLLLVCGTTADEDDDPPAPAPRAAALGPRVAPEGSGWRADTADELRAAMAARRQGHAGRARLENRLSRDAWPG